ncbi:MAG: hypothetical protein U0Q12_18955 [Vicinamibacterales bacterium]
MSGRASADGLVLLATIVLTISSANPLAAQPSTTTPTAADTRLYRVFLQDGSSITSFGEYARVGGRIVFSLPVGDLSAEMPSLQLVSLPDDRIDWARTDAYAESVRAARYAATRGDEEYAQLTNEVATVLNDIATATDPASRLSIAEQLRPQIARWPRDHYGHRSDDVQQVLALLDDIIADLKAQNGQQQFDLALVGGIAASEPRPALLATPTLREAIEQALVVARATDSPDDRQALLASTATLLARHGEELPESWVRPLQQEVALESAREQRLDQAYRALASRALASATRQAARANVKGVQKVLDLVGSSDETLRTSRPQLIESLMDALRARLEAAQRLRLARDQWRLRLEGLHTYEASVHATLATLTRAKPQFEDIRAMAGPEPVALRNLERRLESVTKAIRTVTAPADVESPHAMVVSATQLAATAVRLRLAAIDTKDLAAARDASAAAAGAMMLLDRAKGEIAKALQPPTLP